MIWSAATTATKAVAASNEQVAEDRLAFADGREFVVEQAIDLAVTAAVQGGLRAEDANALMGAHRFGHTVQKRVQGLVGRGR